jgi:hypothetical protein
MERGTFRTRIASQDLEKGFSTLAGSFHILADNLIFVTIIIIVIIAAVGSAHK